MLARNEFYPQEVRFPLVSKSAIQLRAAYHGHAGRPNKAINSGRTAANLFEWHLAGGAQPLAVTMNEGVCLAVEIDPHHIQRR